MTSTSTNIPLSGTLQERWTSINGDQQTASSIINYSPKTISLSTKEESIPVNFFDLLKFIF